MMSKPWNRGMAITRIRGGGGYINNDLHRFTPIYRLFSTSPSPAPPAAGPEPPPSTRPRRLQLGVVFGLLGGFILGLFYRDAYDAKRSRRFSGADPPLIKDSWLRSPLIIRTHEQEKKSAQGILDKLAPYGVPILPYHRFLLPSSLDRHGHSPITFPLLVRSNHVIAFNTRDKHPDWSLEYINAATVGRSSAAESAALIQRGSQRFLSDPHIEDLFQSSVSHYNHSGFDRGHLTPAGDARSSHEAMKDTFYLSNVVPQSPHLNRHYWLSVESFIRDLTKDYEDVFVVTGALYQPNLQEATQSGQTTPLVQYPMIPAASPAVSVPTHLYKIVLCVNANSEAAPPSPSSSAEALAKHEYSVMSFIIPNTAIPSTQPLSDFLVPVCAIERASGYYFFPKLFHSQAFANKAPPPNEAAAALPIIKDTCERRPSGIKANGGAEGRRSCDLSVYHKKEMPWEKNGGEKRQF